MPCLSPLLSSSSTLPLLLLQLLLISFCLSDPCSEKPPPGPLQVYDQGRHALLPLPPLPQGERCSPLPTLVSVDLDPELTNQGILVARPSSLLLRRCSGTCSDLGYHSSCKETKSSRRKVKLLLGFSDGRCEETQIEVHEAEECDCLCNADGCPGESRRAGTLCGCVCLQNNSTPCASPQEWSEPSCSCQCPTISASSCLPLHMWDSPSCSCKMVLTKEEYFAIGIASLGVLAFFLLLLLIRARRRAALIQGLLDSNTDYGQSLHLLKQTVKLKPKQPKMSMHHHYTNTY